MTRSNECIKIQTSLMFSDNEIWRYFANIFDFALKNNFQNADPLKFSEYQKNFKTIPNHPDHPT